MKIDIKRTREALQGFELTRLFVEELGWSRPRNLRPIPFEVEGQQFSRRELAELGGVVVFEITAADGQIPSPPLRKAIHKEISTLVQENLLIFLDQPAGAKPTQSVWYWVKREGKSKQAPREHAYFKGQPGDLFLSKLDAMAVDFGDVAKSPTVTEVADRLKQALDVERVTRKFYTDFKTVHTQFLEHIEGIEDERDRRWYASVLLNRLMFIYFLQRKGFVNNGDLNYLQNKLAATRKNRGDDQYYETFLKRLFFEGFAKPAALRDPADNALLGNIVYLNGGLFLQHPVEARWPGIKVADAAFDNLYDLFGRYSWNLDDTPGGHDDEINPDVLGYIFEKYINQKEFGAYYTAPEITEYLCRQTVENLILERVNSPAHPAAGLKGRHFDSLNELLLRMDAPLCGELYEMLPTLSLLDPACGSGAFLVAALKTLINVYTVVFSKIEVLSNSQLRDKIKKIRQDHPSLGYYIKKQIITRNLFGVDIMEEATEIARLRLFLALVASASSVNDLEPLPNIDFNILAGNSLIGLLRVNQTEYQGRLGDKPYADLVAEKNRLIEIYRNTSLDAAVDPTGGPAGDYTGSLQNLREEIDRFRDEATVNLNNILTDQFGRLKIKYEQARWDAAKKAEGKPDKRSVASSDIEKLRPFHWGFEFNQVMNGPHGGGFDAIITNPPWEIFKPQAKEFFQEYSDLVTKKKMTIKEFEEEQGKLVQDPETLAAWLQYLSNFPHVSEYFRNVPQYANQISVVNGKKAGTDINLYKLFVEQCYNLLREGGQCGIVVPSGIYTDLGTKQLREMLFTKAEITGLFGFENRKEIFEGVHRSFKFVVLSFKKGGQTTEIKSAFMRQDVKELDRFPQDGALPISVDLIRQLSPDSLSIMEFKSDLDVQIARKMLQFPLLGEKIAGKWKLVLNNEFHMTNDSRLFKTAPGPGRLPLFTGRMFHQFTLTSEHSGYWIDEKEGRKALLGRVQDTGQQLDYQGYRWVHRRIARNTDTRTLICTITPNNVFTEVNSTTLKVQETGITNEQMLFLCGFTNSFVLDWLLRQKITTTLNMFYIYQLPVPRLSEGDPQFRPIVERAARLVCTTAEFADLWQAVLPGTVWEAGNVPSDSERASLRAELDGLVAHLYGLSEEEFKYILGTFPLVAQPVKDAALAAYRAFAPDPSDIMLAEMIQDGESDRLEFKLAAYWNTKKNPPAKDESMKNNIIDAVAAFLNSKEGGALVIGVDDYKNIVGLTGDYDAVNPPNLAGVKSKADRDRYELWLHDILKTGFGESLTDLYKIHFHRLNNLDVCRIKVEPAPKPVYVNNGSDMYVRRGGRKEKLKASEIATYIKQRWG